MVSCVDDLDELELSLAQPALKLGRQQLGELSNTSLTFASQREGLRGDFSSQDLTATLTSLPTRPGDLMAGEVSARLASPEGDTIDVHARFRLRASLAKAH
jgi:hypothetical protein